MKTEKFGSSVEVYDYRNAFAQNKEIKAKIMWASIGSVTIEEAIQFKAELEKAIEAAIKIQNEK